LTRKPCFASVGSSGQGDSATDLPPQARPQGNARKWNAAHKHLDRMWDDAENEQIDGRKFWGTIAITVPFEEGVAQDIQASKLARDRVRSA